MSQAAELAGECWPPRATDGRRSHKRKRPAETGRSNGTEVGRAYFLADRDEVLERLRHVLDEVEVELAEARRLARPPSRRTSGGTRVCASKATSIDFAPSSFSIWAAPSSNDCLEKPAVSLASVCQAARQRAEALHRAAHALAPGLLDVLKSVDHRSHPLCPIWAVSLGQCPLSRGLVSAEYMQCNINCKRFFALQQNSAMQPMSRPIFYRIVTPRFLARGNHQSGGRRGTGPLR